MMDIEEIEYCPACGTRLERREAVGRLRPVCPSCGRVHFYDPRVAAVVLVEEEGRVMLVRRVNVPGQGKWTLPGGFVDQGEDPKLAAERECLEETGLQVRITDLIDVIYGVEHPRGASIVIAYRGELVGGQAVAGDDADLVGFFPRNDLPTLAFESTRRLLLPS
jgi:ADP-ribose pyrophosphatase YjhB (NUDIX family)